jgi:hypothetical protein
LVIKNSGTAGIGERIRREAQGRRGKNYWLTVAVLAAGALIMILIFGWGKKPLPPVLRKPSGTKPDFQITSIQEMPARGQERLTIMVLTNPTVMAESLRRVFDWVLFQMLDEYNRVRRRNVKVVWVYVYDQPGARSAEWRAMAVYVDPRLPPEKVPDAARVGGDAVRDGAVTYDFTNPVFDQNRGKM